MQYVCPCFYMLWPVFKKGFVRREHGFTLEPVPNAVEENTHMRLDSTKHSEAGAVVA